MAAWFHMVIFLAGMLTVSFAHMDSPVRQKHMSAGIIILQNTTLNNNLLEVSLSLSCVQYVSRCVGIPTSWLQLVKGGDKLRAQVDRLPQVTWRGS